MKLRYRELVDTLNDPDREVRLQSLRQLMDAVATKKLAAPLPCDSVNNHIHTTYSFSIYSPSRAIWEAYQAGLRSAGIMDHDSICGAEEFIEAGAIVGMATTIGIECRADFSRTRFNGRRINNPDQKSNAYISLHGIPHSRIAAVKDYFTPIILARQKRNKLMIGRINRMLLPFHIAIDYERDVLPLSDYRSGGTVTERHLLHALVRHLIRVFGKGEPLVNFLKRTLGLPVAPRVSRQLLDTNNPYYEFDVLGLLKGEFVGSFYLDATGDECPDVSRLSAFSKKISSICAYAYLGDVTNSVTGDKKDQKFEDGFLDTLIEVIKEIGFDAVTYMPSRNRPRQLARIMDLCTKNGLLQICGEDINSPRQPFISHAMRNGAFRHLVDTTWALIGHEKAATDDGGRGFFSAAMVRKYPDLNKRIQIFKAIGLKTV